MENPVHFPAKADRFEFDEEVSRIFPNMARRSIPLYHEGHQMHVGMLTPMIQEKGHINILDIGASRGEFLTRMQCQYLPGQYTVTFLEASEPMAKHLRHDFPNNQVIMHDLESTDMPTHHKYDVVVLNYVLQFVRPEHQRRVLDKVASMVKDGGVLIYGGKEAGMGPVYDAMHDEYIKFRMGHGYSRQEISAKTRALSGSMWPVHQEDFVYQMTKAGFRVAPTTRFSVFATYFCTKGD